MKSRATFLTARNATVLLPVSLLMLQSVWSGRAFTSSSAPPTPSNNSAPRRDVESATGKGAFHPNGQAADKQNASIALTQVADRLLNPVTLDYHSQSNKLVLLEQSGPGRPSYFELLARDGSRSRLANLDNLTGKVRIAAVRDRRGGFVPGEVLSSTDTSGAIARISPDGSSAKNPWVTLPKETAPMSGGLCVDRWGAFKGDLIAATEKGRVWRIASSGEATLLVDLSTQIEGITTVPDDAAKYGEWAGKILAGAKVIGGVYAIDALGKAAYFNIPVYPQDIELIPSNEDFFGIDSKNGVLWKASAAQFASLAGNILIAQEQPGTLASVRWTGKQFAVETIAHSAQWEQVTFAPNCTTSISPTSAFVSVQGIDGNLTINAPGGCNWTAVSDQSWLDITSPDNGTGDGFITYAVRDNNDRTARTGTISVNGLIFTVTQDGGLGEDCAFSISPGFDSKQASGGSGAINVFAEARCAWQAVSDDSFVVVTSGCCGVGNGIVTYAVFANGGGSRGGTITVAGKIFNVKQKANSPPVVNAGPDQTITLPNTASLSGTIIDDNAPVPATVSWSKISGPQSVILGSASTAPTSAIFSTPGTYVLRLTATDLVFTVSDDVTITVNPDPAPPPPDPATVAPPLNTTVATTIGAATQFLYTGANPIQTGVVPGTISMVRVAVLRGRVVDKNGSPLPLVKISVLNHPEFGQTLSRADGKFDMAVNGGGLMTVKYQKVGLTPLERQMDVPWQDYSIIHDVVMGAYDSNVTFIDLNADIPIQVAQGSTVSDSDGSRQATLLFQQGTTALMTLSNGTTQPLSNLHVRATEYTVGPSGPAAMPGTLPPTSGYTNAIEFSADEAVAVGAKQVAFSQPVIEYLDNFLEFPIGIDVPSGSYDPISGVWVPSANGRVVKVLAIKSGQADLDLDGSGLPADDAGYVALGITQAERQQLAILYSAGQSLWRVPLIHFSGWDSNWGWGPPPDAQPPMARLKKKNCNCPEDQDQADDGNDQTKLDVQNQALNQSVAAPGLGFGMNYRSTRQKGNQSGSSLAIPLSDASLPASVKRIDLEINVAGRTFTQSFPAAINQNTSFTYDGLDGYGRKLQGSQRATVDIAYAYDGVYLNTPRFGYNGNGIPITADPSRQEISLHQIQHVLISTFDAKAQALGGWDFSVHHVYDPTAKVLYQGDGLERDVSQQGLAVNTAAGQLASGYSGDGGQASQALLAHPRSISFAPDGTLYVSDQEGFRVRKITPAGIITTIAGNGFAGETGDGGPATQAPTIAQRMHVARDGSIYIGAARFFGCRRVRRIGTDGIITTVAGGGSDDTSEDIPATQALLVSPNPYPAPDGGFFVGESFNGRVRRVGPDGFIRTVAGGGADYQGEGIPATSASINVLDIAIGADGTLYIADVGPTGNRVRKVGADGRIWTIAGGGNSSLDGIPALDAQLIFGIYLAFEVGPDGTLYLAEGGPPFRIRSVSQGFINTVAGNGTEGYAGNGGLSQSAQTALVGGIAIAADGRIHFSDSFIGPGGVPDYSRVRRLASALPGFSATDIAIASQDGSELYQFDSSGRHLSTINSLTRATIYNFTYDSSGRLTQIADGDGNQTTIERNSAGNPTGILGPYGMHTLLTLDANGYLSHITDAANQVHQFAYTSDGLLTGKTTPRGHSHTFTYNPSGLLTRADDPASGFTTLARTDQITDFTVQENTALSHTSSYQTQNLPTNDQRLVDTDSAGLQSNFLQNQNGTNTYNTPDGMTLSVTLGPDPRFKMQAPLPTGHTVSTPGGLSSTAAFSRVANLSNPNDPLSLVSQTETLNINGRIYTSIFNATTRTFTDSSPVNRQSTTTIDGQGRTTQFQFANLNAANYVYDARGRLSTATFGAAGEARTASLTYDNAGFLSSFTDPIGRAEGYIYDAVGRLAQRTFPDGRVINFAYDANGNLTSVTPPGRPAHSFTFNSLNLVASYTAPNVGGSSQTTYAYNLDRQLTSVTRPDALSLNLAYDTAGRLAALTIPGGQYSYAYNASTGNLSTITAPDGGSLSYTYDGFLRTGTTWAGTIAGSVSRTYDNDFRITSERINGGSVVNFSYDNDSLLTAAGSLTLTRNAQNGLITGIALGNVTDLIGYNNFAESTSYNSKYSTSTTLYDVQDTRDKLGRVTQKTETIGGATKTYAYAYDQAGRLSTVTLNGAGSPFVTYNYDSNSNRTSINLGGVVTSATYDNQDRLAQYGATTYAYTANGELQSKTAVGQTTQYAYDVLGNLRGVTLPGGTQIEYLIDGRDRRIGKKVTGTLTQGFLYQDQLAPVAELDGSLNIVSRFVYGSHANVPDYMVKNGVTYRFITDQLGSVRLVVDSTTGAIAQRIDYDAFGVVLVDTSPGFQPFGFAGGLYDTQTGLVRFGARDYDAQVGRWTAKDPILFLGGEDNLYIYAFNDPINFFDHEGQSPLNLAGQGAAPLIDPEADAALNLLNSQTVDLQHKIDALNDYLKSLAKPSKELKKNLKKLGTCPEKEKKRVKERIKQIRQEISNRHDPARFIDMARFLFKAATDADFVVEQGKNRR